MKYLSKILRKFRRPALWALAGVAAAGVALLAALWISALVDPVPSRRFTYRDGTSTLARQTWIERLDGRQTPVDARSLSRWRRLRFNLWHVNAPDEVSGFGDDTVSESLRWDGYRRLCDEVTALIASGEQSEKLPNLAAFTATQAAWADYCRAFINAKSWDIGLMQQDATMVWLLERRRLQLRRLKNSGRHAQHYDKK